MSKKILIVSLNIALLLCVGGMGVYWAKAEALARQTEIQAGVIAELNQKVAIQGKEIQDLKQVINRDPIAAAQRSIELSAQKMIEMQKADSELQKQWNEKWSAETKKLSDLLEKQKEEISRSLLETTPAPAQPNF